MLGHNETQLDSYNKNVPKTSGTLIANWFQQRIHRQNRGQGRATTKNHVPKKHQQLIQTGIVEKPQIQDDTKYRIIGQVNHPIPRTQNYHYGKGHNKADTFAKTGRKQQLLQKLYLQEVKMNIEQQQKRKQQQSRKGIFQTTSKSTFTPKPLNQNQIGKLIMYDQNGVKVSSQNVDDDLRQANRFKDRAQISSDQQLRKLLQTNVSYEKQQPVTFWRQKLQDGTYYMSKNGVAQPFAKNNQFLKTFQHYKHYKD